ncbi:MAG: hypothetical protein ABIA91_02470, partial [Patescibacteria group bacterium]
MINTATRIKKISLFIGDVFILYFSLWLTLLIRYNQAVTAEKWTQHFMPFTLIFILWLIVFYITSFYDLSLAKNNVVFFANFFRSIFLCAGLAIAFFYLFDAGIAPKTNLFLHLLIFTLLLIIWRQLFNKLAGANALQSNVLILGHSSTIIDLASEI